MTIYKIISNDPHPVVFWELSDYYLKIAYTNFIVYGANYHINPDMFSIEDLIKAIPLYADKIQKDTIALYTERTLIENQELISKLEELITISKGTINGHDFWFQKCLLFCKEQGDLWFT